MKWSWKVISHIRSWSLLPPLCLGFYKQLLFHSKCSCVFFLTFLTKPTFSKVSRSRRFPCRLICRSTLPRQKMLPLLSTLPRSPVHRHTALLVNTCLSSSFSRQVRSEPPSVSTMYFMKCWLAQVAVVHALKNLYWITQHGSEISLFKISTHHPSHPF